MREPFRRPTLTLTLALSPPEEGEGKGVYPLSLHIYSPVRCR